MARRLFQTPNIPPVGAELKPSLESLSRVLSQDTTENAIRTNLGYPKDGTEDFEAPLPLQQLATADLPDPVEWAGTMVYDTDIEQIVWSDGAAWIPMTAGVVGTSIDDLTDPNADRILFWDDSEGKAEWLTVALPLSITSTTIDIALASETQDGTAEMATDAEIRSATTGAKALMAEDLETAAALVTLTETGGAIAVDWDTFINGIVTIDENSTISNPSNGQPGTHRTIIVQGNNSTDRTLSFGNQYFGPGLTSIADLDSTKRYLVSIYCETSSVFWVGYLPTS